MGVEIQNINLILSNVIWVIFAVSSDLESSGKPVELSEGKVLELIESCFPNPVCAAELARTWGWPEEDILQHLTQLQNKGLVKALEHGGFTRVQQTDAKVQVYK